MKTHMPGRTRRYVSLLLVSGVLAGLASCGGSDNSGAVSTTYLYIVGADVQGKPVPGTVYQYLIGSGASIESPSVAPVPAGVTPTAVVSHPSGHYLYVANLGDATISQYGVGAGGELTALSPAVVSVSAPSLYARHYSLSVAPQGQFLYLVINPRDSAGLSASIAQYSIGNDGTLTPLSPGFINVPASGSGPLALDPSGRYAYLAGTNGSLGQVAQFSIGGDGTLTPQSPATVSATAAASSVAIAPGGQTAYVLSTCIDLACDGQVATYTIGPTGALSPTGLATITGSHVNPVELVTDSAGSSAYLLTNLMGIDTNAGAVYQYSIDSTGGLVPGTPPSLSVASGSVSESVSGVNLYALSANAVGQASGLPPGGHLDHYAIGSGGQLSVVGSIAVEASLPTAMAFVVVR